MRSPSSVFYFLLFLIFYTFDISIFWYIVLPVLVAWIGALFIRRFIFETILQLPPPPNDIVVITGAGAGFGREFSLGLASKGLTVFAGIRKEEDGEKLLETLQPQYRQFMIPVILDVTNQENINDVVSKVKAKIESEGKHLFGVINNAGVQIIDPLEFLSVEKFRAGLEVNLIGAHAVTRAFIPILRENKGSRVIFIGSIAGLQSVPMLGAYCASKSALESLADTYRMELLSFGVYVSLIEPGTFKTDMIGPKFYGENLLEEDKGPYTPKFRKFVTQVNSFRDKFPHASWIEDQMERVLFARFPPARAAFGFEAILLPFVSFLPDSVIDKVLQFM